jgi:universal stress protein A
VTIRKILVPTDFSAHSNSALDRAIELARPLAAQIVLVHSYYVHASMTASGYVGIPPAFMAQLRKDVGSELDGIAARVVQAGVPCEWRVSAEPSTSAILELAESLPADLIVMGTHGHTGMKHVLLGSTAARIVRLAPCPVLTVRDAQS